MIKSGYNKVNESVTLKQLQDAQFSSSFMNDRASINIDNQTYVKIGKNKWEHIPANPHAFGGTYTDSEILDKVKKSKKCKLDESVDAYGLKTGGTAKSASNSASINENGSRYNLYKTRITKAISKKDVETLKRTKEAIMYASASALKNSQAEELISMIKKALGE